MRDADRQKARKIIEKAEKHARAQKWKKALDAYEQAHQLDASNDRIMRRVGDIRLRLDMQDEAIEIYQRLAELYACNGFWAKSISVYKIILDLDPNDREVQIAISKLYTNLGINSSRGAAPQAAASSPTASEAPTQPQREDRAIALDEEAEASEPLEIVQSRNAEVEAVVAPPDEYFNTCVNIFDVEQFDDSDAASEEAPLELSDEVLEPTPVTADTVSAAKANAQGADAAMRYLSGGVAAGMELEMLDLEADAVVLEAEVVPEQKIRVPLFSELNSDEFIDLLAKTTTRRVPKEAEICRKGQKGDSIYLIVSGTAAVMGKSKSGAASEVAELEAPQFFGEFGLLSDGRRHATVKAKTDMELLEFTKRDIRSVIERYPRVLSVLNQYYKERVVSSVVTSNAVFNQLNHEEIYEFVRRFHMRKVPENAYLFKEGDQGGDLFFIKSGSFEVSIKRGHDILIIARLAAGDFFGEISLITGKPRTATLRSEKDSEVLALSADEAQEIFAKLPEIRSKLERVVVQRAEDAIAAFQSHEEFKSGLAIV